MELAEFQERLRSSPRPVVVDLWAPWCGPCRMMLPVLQRAEKQFEGKVDVWRINADESPALLNALGVWGIPTLLAFQQEREIGRRTGAQPPQAMQAFFQAALDGTPPANPARAAAGIPLASRGLRFLSALALFYLAWQSASYLLLATGLLILFSAVHDRCPIWRAVRQVVVGRIQSKKEGEAHANQPGSSAG